MEQLPAILQDTAAKISSITRKSDKFLSQDADLYEKSKLFTKVLYDITKLAESKPSKLTLPELIIEDFNPEQVWAGVELQNQDKFTKLESQFNSFHIKDLSQQPLLIGKPSLKNVGNEPLEEEFEYDLDDDVSDSENIVDDEEKLPDDPDVSDDADEKSEGSDDDILNDPDFQNMSDSDGDDLPLFQDLDENEIDSEADGDEEKKSHVERTSESKGRRTEIDDKFFKLSDMEKFHDMEDPSDILNSKKSEEDELVDMFGDIPDDDDANTMYKDYWVDADPDSAEIGNDSDADDQDESEDNIEMSDNNDVSGDDGGSEEVTKSKLLESSDEEEESVAKSSHEVANERLAKKINKMEEAAVGDKAWQMGGEVSAPVRPENSLLSEHLEYDSAAKQAPVITEEVSRKLEDIILQRIKDKAWDDVERKVKPVEDPFEYKKKLVLDQEKSKLSLAQIYEEEFMKVAEQSTEKKVSVGLLDKEQEETPEEVEEIKSMMNSLFRKLDSLSHLHFTPKQKSAELKVVRNIPTIAMEEVAPVAATNADLLAPAEVVDKKKGELVDDKEKTKTDRKREKREKKAKLKAKIKEKERKEKLVSKLNPGLGNKYSKEKALKQLEEAEKQGKVINLNKKKKDDSVKNSKSFFSNLQDEVKTHVREKGVEKKRKSKSNSMNAASLKL